VIVPAKERFKKGLFESEKRNGESGTSKNPMGTTVVSTLGGSMTQSTFYNYAEHFVANISTDHEPLTLFLDGHASRWSISALRLLLNNNVFPFFLPSHTSIWSQPNDCGVNIRLHRAIELAVKQLRRWETEANLSYFNHILRTGWDIFIRWEQKDMAAIHVNNATTAYFRTGIYPLNPYSETKNKKKLFEGYDFSDDANDVQSPV